MNIPAAELPDWYAIDEIATGGVWTVREGAAERPALLIASGLDQDMRLIAAAPKMAKLLALYYVSANPDPVLFKRRAAAILNDAGIRP